MVMTFPHEPPLLEVMYIKLLAVAHCCVCLEKGSVLIGLAGEPGNVRKIIYTHAILENNIQQNIPIC